jgi:hypothetical protein
MAANRGRMGEAHRCKERRALDKTRVEQAEDRVRTATACDESA